VIFFVLLPYEYCTPEIGFCKYLFTRRCFVGTILVRNKTGEINAKTDHGKTSRRPERLVEGNSINATVRMTGVCKVTVLRLLADAGQFCADYHDVYVRGLSSKRVQLDEVWAFCGCKDKAKQAGAGGYGSVWTWVALDADSKLCISYLVGDRGPECAEVFVATPRADLRDESS